MNRCVVFFAVFCGIFLFCPRVAEAATFIDASTVISAPAAWTLSGSPYVVQGNYTLRVTSILTIDPGVAVKFQPNRTARRYNGMRVEDGGRLIAEGTADAPIVFTSSHDDTVGGDSNSNGSATVPQAGDWESLRFVEDASVLSHVEVRYGGQYREVFGAVETSGMSAMEVRDSAVRDSGSAGVRIEESSAPTFTRVTIENNAGHGVSATVTSGEARILDSIVRGNGSGALRVSVENSLRVENTEFIENIPQTVDVRGEEITHDTVWQYIPNLVYTSWNDGRIFVRAGASLTLEPGVAVKMLRESGLYVEGELIADGTEDEPVVFTAYTDDAVGGDTNFDGAATVPEAGDWGGVYVDHGTASFAYATLRYGGLFQDDGGFDDRSLIHVRDSVVSMSNVTLADSYDTGVYVSGASTVSFDDSDVARMTRGLDVWNNSFAMSNNSFFDITSVALRQNGTGQIDARRNWWGDDSGPSPAGRGELVVGNVLYDPWIGKRDPVILIPGILGTEMWREEELLWPNPFSLIFSLLDDFMDPLAMNESGEAGDESIMFRDVIRNVPLVGLPVFHYFDRLVENLELQGYTENVDLFVFPYDWRLDIQTNSERLNSRIQEILSQTGGDKVDIVAHSMGGLLTKQYALDHGSESVDTVIFVGTPHLGSPDAAKTLLFGSNAGMGLGPISFLNEGEIKKIGRNMTSVYQLLPSGQYFSAVSAYFDDLTQPFVPNYFETMDFLASQDLNAGHLDRAEAFHTPALDNFVVSYGVNAFNISGCKEPTLGRIIRRNSGVEDEYTLGFIAGDGTVPLGSSDALDLPQSHKFYLNDTDHGQMPSEEDTRQLIVDLIRRPDQTPVFTDNVTQSNTGCSIRGRVVSVHSPVDIHVYDSNGNHVGPTADGNLDLGIPGVAYENIANNKFVFLPDGTDYEIELDATDVGTFNMRVADIEDNVPTQTTYYNAVPIVPESAGYLDDTLHIDYDGDGSYEAVEASAVLDSVASSDLVKPVTQIQTDSTGWTRGSVEIVLSASDDNSGILRTEYSLDNGATWQAYATSFVVSSENVVVFYRSIDRAGNIEETQSYHVQIDQTPPEAAFMIDAVTKEILVTGVDALSGTVVTEGEPNLFVITDEAGNTTEVQTTETRTDNTFDYYTASFQVTQIRRSGGARQTPERNQIFAQWQTDDTGALVWLQEALQVKNEFYIIGKYDAATDETTVWRKGASGLQEEGRVPGVALPTLQTEDLSFIYY